MVQSVEHQPGNTVVRPVSQLQRLWMNGGFAITAQFPPPLTAQAGEFVAQVAAWATHFDALLAADAPEGAIALSSLTMALVLRRAEIETIVQMSGRDRNRLALQSDILSLSVLGLPNLLVDTRPVTRSTLGQNPDARLVTDLSGLSLLAAAARLRDEARFSSGANIKVPPIFYLGALVTPEAHLPVEELDSAQFLVTTPVRNTQNQLDMLASFCATHANFLHTRPLLASLLLTPDEGSRHPNDMPVAADPGSTGTPLSNLSTANYVGRGGRSPSGSQAHRRPIPLPCDQVGERPPGSAGDTVGQQHLLPSSHNQDTVVETCVQRMVAAIQALKACAGVRGCNIVVERLADLVLLERVALALSSDGEHPHAY